jgi:SAM-dependent methyltransferase
MISVAARDHAPSAPRIGHWVQLMLAGDHFTGEIQAHAAEPLPFADDAFDVVVLRHVLQSAPEPAALLQEVIRVLNPGGCLVLTGIHPLSAWAPWWSWQMRGRTRHMSLPMQLAARLRGADIKVESLQRVGHVLPMTSLLSGDASGVLGGGYVLRGSKRRTIALPTRLRPSPVAAPINARLVPGAGRSVATLKQKA